MDARIFRGAFTTLFVAGVVAGLALAGVIRIIAWLIEHVRIEWV